MHLFIGRAEVVVLGRDDNCMDTDRLSCLSVVFNCELGFGIRAKVVHDPGLVVADIRKDAESEVAQVEGERHIVLGFAAGISEHHSLVPGSL